jgi:NAD(P)-dependent dehydrogenase (short-subunit alcohol dehydrogenase family)
MQTLKDKVAVITGAASGIGRALALQLAEAGCRLALCDHNDVELNETRKMAIEKGATVVAVPFDVSHREDMRNFAAEVLQVFGNAWILSSTMPALR